MKKAIFTTLAIVLIISNCFSQDTITFRSLEEVQAKVFEITSTDIKYKKFDNPNGPVFIILRSDVLSIRYENGTKDIFNTEKDIISSSPATPASTPVSIPTPLISGNDYFMKGQKDATRYYVGYTGAGTGTLVTSLISPLIGLVPAIACAATPPKQKNLNFPSAELLKNPDYHRGYDARARKMKQGKVWTNWGVGLGVNLVLVLLFTASQ